MVIILKSSDPSYFWLMWLWSCVLQENSLWHLRESYLRSWLVQDDHKIPNHLHIPQMPLHKFFLQHVLTRSFILHLRDSEITLALLGSHVWLSVPKERIHFSSELTTLAVAGLFVSVPSYTTYTWKENNQYLIFTQNIFILPGLVRPLFILSLV